MKVQLSEKSKAEFIELIAKDSITCWFEGDEFVMPSGQGKTAKGIVLGKLLVWQYRQTEVDELQASYHGEMIGHNHHLGKVKKERDELQKRVDAAIYLLTSIKAENDLWGCDQVERQIELLEQAIKGGSND